MPIRMGTMALAAVVVLLLAACGNTNPEPPPGEEEPSAAPWEEVTTEHAWTLAGYTPVSAVEAIDDSFVLYALDENDELTVIGVDAADGEVRWEHPASPSFVIRGVGLWVAVHENLAVFLTPSTPGEESSGAVDVAGVDAATGELQHYYAGVRTVTDHPVSCNDAQSVCFVGRQGDSRFWYVVDFSGGQEGVLVPVEDGRRLGANLFPASDSADLVRIEFDGTEAWQRPARDLFGGADVSPDSGWQFRNQDGRYVGQLGIEWDEDPDGTARLDLAARVMAAFDEATGEPLWHEPGTFICAGIEFTLDHPVRCRSTGQWIGRDGEEELSGEVTVEGFDPATGATRWAWEAGEVPGLVFRHESLRRVDDTTYAVATDDGDMVLDVAAGEWLPVTEPPPGWCSDRVQYPVSPEVVEDDELRVTEWWPCEASGDPLELPVTVPDFAGSRAGDVFAWVDRGEVRAVTVRD